MRSKTIVAWMRSPPPKPVCSPARRDPCARGLTAQGGGVLCPAELLQSRIVEAEVVADLVYERDAHPGTQRVEVGTVLLHVVLVQRDPVGKLPEAVDPAC